MEQSLPYIEALNRQTGLDIRLSSSGAARLDLDGRGILLQWLENLQQFIVYAEIGPLYGWRDGDVMKQLLSANFLFMQTRGGALSYDPAANMVGLNYTIPVYGLLPEDFVKRLDVIVTLAAEWRERLHRMSAEQERLATRSSLSEGAVSSAEREQNSFADMQNMMKV